MKPVTIIALLIVACTYSLASCGLDFSALFEKTPPHITLPFSLAEKGHVLTTDFKAGDKTYTYSFFLDFHVKNDDPEDLYRIAKILGLNEPDNGGTYKDANGHFIYIRTGIAIPLRLTISRVDGNNEAIVYNEEFNQLWSLGGSRIDILKLIVQVKLEPALYRVRLESLGAVNELADTPVNFNIGTLGTKW
jgi:hypothetical protein